GFLQLFLAEGAVIFKVVGISGATNNRFTGGAECLGFSALSQGVIEDDNVGPFDVLFTIAGFRHKAVGDVSFFFGFDVVTNFMSFFNDLPGNIADQAGE